MTDPAPLAQLRRDPIGFYRLCWPDGAGLWSKQRDILESLIDTQETFVPSANVMGKTHAAAAILLWWVSTRFPAQCLVFSSSQIQLLNALIPQAAKLLRSSAVPLGLTMRHREICMRQPGSPRMYEEHFVRFHVTRTLESFQGVHLPGGVDDPSVLVIFEEASGIDDLFYVPAQTQAHRLLAIANPINNDNFFYRQCEGGDLPDVERPGKFERRVIPIDGDQSPNVLAGQAWRAKGETGPIPEAVPGVLSYHEYQRSNRNWDEAKKCVHLHGRFYKGGELSLFRPDWLDAAEDIWRDLQKVKRGPVFWLGVDVAAGGRDLNCWVVTDHLGVVEVDARKSMEDTTIIQKLTLAIMAKYDIAPRRVCFDYGAGGKQHVDYMRQAGSHIRSVNFGAGARDKKAYVNRRVEMYCLLARAFDPTRWAHETMKLDDGQVVDRRAWALCFALPPDDHLLRQELAVLPIQYERDCRQSLPSKRPTGKKVKGAVYLEDLLGRSPDRADSLALSYWARAGGAKGIPRYTRPLMVSGAGESEEGVEPEPPLEETDPEGKQAVDEFVSRIFGS